MAGRPQRRAAAGVRCLEFTVTIKNGSAQEINGGGFVLRASANGEELDRVFDSGNKIGGEPAITVLPGRSATYRAPAPVTCTTQNAIPDLQDSL